MLNISHVKAFFLEDKCSKFQKSVFSSSFFVLTSSCLLLSPLQFIPYRSSKLFLLFLLFFLFFFPDLFQNDVWCGHPIRRLFVFWWRVSSSYKLRDWLGLKYYESHFFLFTWFYHSHLFQIFPPSWTEHRGARTNANRLLRRSAETIALIKMAFIANEAESIAGKRSNIFTSLSLPPLAKSTSSHIIRKNAPFFNCED